MPFNRATWLENGATWKSPNKRRRVEKPRHYAKRTRAHWTPERLQVLKELNDQAVPPKEISEQLGIHVETVRVALRRLRDETDDLAAMPVPPRILAPWPEWARFDMSHRERARLKAASQ